MQRAWKGRAFVVSAFGAVMGCGSEPSSISRPDHPPSGSTEAAGIAKLAPTLYRLVHPATLARIEALISELRRAAAAEDGNALAVASEDLLALSPSLHPREQLDHAEPTATLFVRVRSERVADVQERVRRLGGYVRLRTPSELIVSLPARRLRDLVEDAGVLGVESDDLVSTALDGSVPETNADDVHTTGAPPQTGPHQGAGVVVGVVDTGLDVLHGDFRKPSTNATRVLHYLDTVSTAVPSGSTCTLRSSGGFTLGVECNEAAINSALNGGSSLPGLPVQARDTDGHGTHVAGIAASNGKATGTHAGMAPLADLIIVGDVTRGGGTLTPLTDQVSGLLAGAQVTTQLATYGFSSAIVEGVAYVFEKAALASKPAVVNLSSGGKAIGPHDGTTAYEAMIDDLTGPGKIVVASAGNLEGSGQRHFGATVTAGSSTAITIQLNPTGSAGARFAAADAWFGASDSMCVSITDPATNTTLGPYGPSTGTTIPGCSPAPCTSAATLASVPFSVCFGKNAPSSSVPNPDYEVVVQALTPSGTPLPNKAFTLTFSRTAGASGSGVLDVWSSASDRLVFPSGDKEKTIETPCTAKNVVCVGSYVVDTPFTGDTLYGLRSSSAHGPTRNPTFTGPKPTLAAPGHIIESAHATNTTTSKCGGFGACVEATCEHLGDCGTSQASPHVTGAVALMLEVAPWLGPQDVIGLLRGTACTSQGSCSTCTAGGACPSPFLTLDDGWGAGKLNALAAVAAAAPLAGFPTEDGDDGKFITVTGQPFATVQNQNTQLLIGIPSGQAAFALQAFDGDHTGGSMYDTDEVANPAPSTARTCFDLYSSVNKSTPDTASPIVRVEGSTLPDAAWGTLYSGPVFGAASGSGAHFYILDVYLTDGPCGQPFTAISAGLTNSFKIRATGQVSTVANDFAFIARDLSGPFAVGPLADTLMPDTNYDGQFRFFIDVASGSTTMTLRDADADILVDDDPAIVGQFGANDVKADGVATGRSADTQYEVFDPNGLSMLLVSNPSGNNNGVDVFDEEEHSLDVSSKVGPWEWRWRGVHVQNNVRIWAPFGSPVTFELFGEPAKRLSPSGARPIEYWLSAALEDFLPITLGSDSTAIVIGDQATALQVLSGESSTFLGTIGKKVTICHHPLTNPDNVQVLYVGARSLPMHIAHGDDVNAPRLISTLAAELLATKLNVADGAARGENLLAAFVYTRTWSVPDVIAAADAALVSGDAVCALSAQQEAAIEELIVLLHAINHAELTYAVPDVAAFTASRALHIAAPGGPGESRGM
jgi:subtilisin family serine protease